MIFREVGVHVATGPAVGDRFLLQGEGQAPDHSAKILASRQVRIDDAASGKSADEAGYADLAEIWIHLYFSEDRAMRIERTGFRDGGMARHLGRAGHLGAAGPRVLRLQEHCALGRGLERFSDHQRVG
jgi:hypothetical protein